MTLLATALGMVFVPLAPLYCAGDDPAAMACCGERPDECNQPAASADACCRDAPAQGQTLSAAAVSKVEPLTSVALAAVASTPIAAVAQEQPAAVQIRWLGLPQDRPPPPLSVLRL